MNRPPIEGIKDEKYFDEFPSIAIKYVKESADYALALESELLNLTPGGTEFHNEPQRCLEWIKDRLQNVTKQVKKRKEAEQELETYKLALELACKHTQSYTCSEYCKGDISCEECEKSEVKHFLSLAKEAQQDGNKTD